MEFKIDKKFRKLMELHVSQPGDSYRLMCESEWKAIKDYIGTPKRVLELGCGLGRMSIYANWMLKNNDIHWILADSTCVLGTRPKFGWNPNKKRYYNDLRWTEEFARTNGLVNFEIFDIEQRDLNSLEDIDLVMSFLSVGFHYPIEDYLQTLLNITTDDCRMIFGVRKGKYEQCQLITEYFNDILLQPQNGPIYTKEDMLILMGKGVG